MDDRIKDDFEDEIKEDGEPEPKEDNRSRQFNKTDLLPAYDMKLARFELDKQCRERVLQMREEEIALQRLRLRQGRSAALVAAFLVTAGMGVWAAQAGFRAAWERQATRERLALERQRFEYEMVAKATAHPDPRQRARNLAFLTQAGFLPQSAAHIPALAPSSAPASVNSAIATRPSRTLAALPPRLTGLQTPGARTALLTPPVSLPSPAAPGRTARLAEPPPLPPLPEPSVREANRRERALVALAAGGYYRGPVDGRRGPNTREAVARFQREQGLKDDGILGPVTLRRIERTAQEGGPER